MHCHCANSTKKAEATCKGYSLSYEICKGCGRQDGYVLTTKDSDAAIAMGQEARLLYVRHEESNARPSLSLPTSPGLF